MKLACLLMLLALAAAPFKQEQPDTRPATQSVSLPPAEALALLRQLDDSEYARREEAEQDLYSLVLSHPALEEWLTSASRREASPEVRARASSVLSKLAEHRLLGATLITLNVQQVHPRELIRALSEQSGVKFDYWPQDPWDQGGAADGRVSLEVSNVPFWEAMRQVSAVTGVHPVEHQATSAGAIVLSPHAEHLDVVPTIHHGAFAVQIRRINRSQTSRIELGVGPDGAIAGNSAIDSSMHVEVRLLVEPKIRLSGNVSQPILDEVIDESGQTLMIRQDPRFGGGRGWSNASSGWSVQSVVMLDAKAASNTRLISRMRGRIEAEIATQMDSLEVKMEELADVRRLREGEKRELSKRYRVGPYRLELTSIQRGPDDSLQIEMGLAWDQLPDVDQQSAWPRAQALLNSMRMEDASGRQWSSQNMGSTWEGPMVRTTRTFHRSGSDADTPVRLLLEVPTRVMPISVPFEFTDIPLPQWE